MADQVVNFVTFVRFQYVNHEPSPSRVCRGPKSHGNRNDDHVWTNPLPERLCHQVCFDV